MGNDTKRKSFVFYIEWQEVLMEYPSEVRLEVYDAIIRYAASGMLSELKPLAKMAFSFIKKQIDSNNDKYNCLIAKRSEAGKKGMAIRHKSTITNPTSDNKDNTCYQGVTNPTSDNKDNYNEPDNVNDNNNSLSNAQAHGSFPSSDILEKPLKECYDRLVSNQVWAETLTMNTRSSGFSDFTLDSFHEYLKRFFAKLQNEGESVKSIKDAMSHFARWLEIELKKQRDDRARAKTFGGATKAARSFVQGEAGKTASLQSNPATPKDYSGVF